MENSEDFEPIGELAPDIGKLPNEVLSLILELLNVADLKAARLAYKRFAGVGRRLLATLVYVTETEESFERLLDISNQNEEIVNSVKTLVYVAFNMIDKAQIQPGRPFEPPKVSEVFAQQAKLRESRSIMADTRHNTNILTEFLCKVKPEKIVVVCADSFTHMSHKHFDHVTWFHNIKGTYFSSESQQWNASYKVFHGNAVGYATE